MTTRTANAARQTKPAEAEVKSTKGAKAEAKPATPPVEALVAPTKAQKSVQIKATLKALPKGQGGVRFTETPAKDGSKAIGDFYIEQPVFALLGKPSEVTLSIKAG